MALQPLLVFVVLSGQLYPLSSDSESDSEPDELEREGGGVMVFHLCLQALMRGGGAGKNPHSPPNLYKIIMNGPLSCVKKQFIQICELGERNCP